MPLKTTSSIDFIIKTESGFEKYWFTNLSKNVQERIGQWPSFCYVE